MCLENCLMIGIMMPVGVGCLSTLSPTNTEDKIDPADTKQDPLDAFCTPPAIQRRPVCLMSIRIKPHPQVCLRGDVRHQVFPAEQPFHAPA